MPGGGDSPPPSPVQVGLTKQIFSDVSHLTNMFLNIKVESGDDHTYYVDRRSQNRLIESIFINDGFLNSFLLNGKPYHPDLAIIKLDNSFQNFHPLITVQVNPLWKSMDTDADFIRDFNPQDYAGLYDTQCYRQ